MVHCYEVSKLLLGCSWWLLGGNHTNVNKNILCLYAINVLVWNRNDC